MFSQPLIGETDSLSSLKIRIWTIAGGFSRGCTDSLDTARREKTVNAALKYQVAFDIYFDIYRQRSFIGTGNEDVAKESRAILDNTSDATVKGLIFRGAQRWLKENFPEDVYRRFLAALPSEDREVWTERPFLATSQLPASLYVNMYQAFLDVWGVEGDTKFREAAGAVAFYDLSSVMKIFMRLGTPSLVASRFPVIYNRYFNIGEFVYVSSPPGVTLTAELRGAEVYGRAGCEGTHGWTHKALTFSGARELRINQVECVFNGAGVCRYEFRWK